MGMNGWGEGGEEKRRTSRERREAFPPPSPQPHPSHFSPLPLPSPIYNCKTGCLCLSFSLGGVGVGVVKSSEVQCDVSCRELTFGQQNHWLLAQIERAVLNC